ncbi:MAG TPA: serine/threonine-protein kinase [Polyangiaceae bacterium]
MAVDIKVASQRAESRIGSVIKNKWRLDRVLGVGGMASVYAATHRNKKRAALKMLHRELSSDTAVRERFLREGYLANSVAHRGAVSVDDDDLAEDGSAFLVMELLDGETIEQRWRRKGERLPLEEVLAVADQVLDTLAAAHEMGVVHRDLKPENLFLTRDGVVKLLDFGIGRLKEMKGVPSTTLSGAAMGTPAFMAPEQARGSWEEVDGQTDLWALAASLYTLLTGQYVHRAATVNETLAMAVTHSAPSIQLLRPDLPPRVVALLDKALAFAKPQRFADARAMQAEVRLVYAQLSGNDVSLAERLSVPDLSPSASRIPLREPTDPRQRQTMAQGVSSSRLPAQVSAISSARRAPPWRLAAGGVLLVGLSTLLARGCIGEADDAGRLPSAASPPEAPRAAMPPASTAPIAAAPEDAAGVVPQVSVDELPRERPNKVSGAGTPAKKDDSLTRRR